MCTYRHDLAQILKVLLIVDRQLIVQILDAIVLDLRLKAHAQRVIAREVRRFAHQKQAVVARLQQMLGLVARNAAMEPGHRVQFHLALAMLRRRRRRRRRPRRQRTRRCCSCGRRRRQRRCAVPDAGAGTENAGLHQASTGGCGAVHRGGHQQRQLRCGNTAGGGDRTVQTAEQRFAGAAGRHAVIVIVVVDVETARHAAEGRAHQIVGDGGGGGGRPDDGHTAVDQLTAGVLLSLAENGRFGRFDGLMDDAVRG